MKFLLAILLLSHSAFAASSAIQTGVGANPLPVANGGTGAASLTAHGAVLGNGASGVSVTSAGITGMSLVSNGASADPAFQVKPGARYHASATALSGSLATIVWTTSDWDTNSAMSSGVFTCPQVGKYQVNASLAVSGTFILNNTVVMDLQYNAASWATSSTFAGGAITNALVSVSDIVNCAATSDTIRVQVSSSATGPAILSSNVKNWISIQKVD